MTRLGWGISSEGFPEEMRWVENYLDDMDPGSTKIVVHNGEAFHIEMTAGFMESVGNLAITPLGSLRE